MATPGTDSVSEEYTWLDLGPTLPQGHLMSHAATKVHQRKTYVSLNSGPHYEGGLCWFRGGAFYSTGDRRFLGPSSWSHYLPFLALLLCMCLWKHPGEGASWKTVG